MKEKVHKTLVICMVLTQRQEAKLEMAELKDAQIFVGTDQDRQD